VRSRSRFPPHAGRGRGLGTGRGTVVTGRIERRVAFKGRRDGSTIIGIKEKATSTPPRVEFSAKASLTTARPATTLGLLPAPSIKREGRETRAIVSHQAGQPTPKPHPRVRGHFSILSKGRGGCCCHTRSLSQLPAAVLLPYHPDVTGVVTLPEARRCYAGWTVSRSCRWVASFQCRLHGRGSAFSRSARVSSPLVVRPCGVHYILKLLLPLVRRPVRLRLGRPPPPARSMSGPGCRPPGNPRLRVPFWPRVVLLLIWFALFVRGSGHYGYWREPPYLFRGTRELEEP